jgi:Mce-associated membrane protein
MVNQDTRRALALAGGRPRRPTRIAVRRSVMPDDETEFVEPITDDTQTPAATEGTDDIEAPEAGDDGRGVAQPRRGPGAIWARSTGGEPRHVRARSTAAGRFPRGRLTRWASMAVLAAAILVIAVQGRQWYELRQLDSAREQALAAARQTTVNFVTISAGSVDRDLQRVADGATGDFKDEFTKGLAQVRAAVIENKVDSQGTVLRAAIVSADRSSAIVLVAVDATVHNVNAPDGRLTHYRIRTNLARVGGAWLVSKLEFVG